MAKKHIYLLGFMGSGKSYWGRKIAKVMDLPFIDLDDFIEEKNQMTITQIFETKGAAQFRSLERDALKTTIKFPKSIIALGGGTPCFFDNMNIIHQNGISIYLETSVDVLVERLISETAHRPLLKRLSQSELIEYISQTLEERNIFYTQADITMNSNGKVLEQIQNHLNK